MTKEEFQEMLERYRRFQIHLVKPADSEMMQRLDQEIYIEMTQENSECL
jgi:hypothetical protein